MASTNKTTHYELSQYVGSDKPTYLTDYNTDMYNIDAGIYGAKSLADTNAGAIGDLSNLSTTAQNNLVSAINEVDGDVATNTANISTNTHNIDTNTTAIGTLANLTTSSKTDLVVAINEVDANCDSNASKIGDLTNLTTNDKSNIVSAVNEVNYNVGLFNLSSFETITNITMYDGNNNVYTGTTLTGSIEVAKNADGSLAKIYGSVKISRILNARKISFQTSLRPATDITINGHVTDVTLVNDYNTPVDQIKYVSMTIKTDGTVEVPFSYTYSNGSNKTLLFTNSLLFIKDFGDTPIPQPEP